MEDRPLLACLSLRLCAAMGRSRPATSLMSEVDGDLYCNCAVFTVICSMSAITDASWPPLLRTEVLCSRVIFTPVVLWSRFVNSARSSDHWPLYRLSLSLLGRHKARSFTYQQQGSNPGDLSTQERSPSCQNILLTVAAVSAMLKNSKIKFVQSSQLFR